MINDPDGSGPGWRAPWASRRNMLIMAIAGPILGLLLLIIGLLLLAAGHPDIPMVVIGAALEIFWLVAIPVARRRGKL